MSRRLLPLAAAAAALAACGGGSGPGSAVPSRQISIGSAASATLRTSDPRLDNNSIYHMWRFSGSSGQTVQIDMESRAFDTFLILQDANGTELVRNDDGGEGLNARIIYTLPSSGTYRVIARTYRAGDSGSYTLRVASLGMARPSAGARTISRGQTVTGTLTANDPRLNDNSVYHAYTYSGRAGETITVEVISSDFDAYALIQDNSGNRLASDDDSGGNLNARLQYTLPYTGTFRIIANTYRENAYGRYTLRVY